MQVNEFQWFKDMLEWAKENGMEVSVTHLGLKMVEITLTVKDEEE